VQPAKGGEGGKNVFQANDLFKFTLKNNQGVFRVLKHEVGKMRGKRMTQFSTTGGKKN